MSELNYINETVVPRTPKSIIETVVVGMSKSINETVVPRMPKSVSDEQLFVFVPTGSDIIAGIFKINTNDFDKNSLPVLTIKQDKAVTQNGTGFVRGGAVYSFVTDEDGKLQKQITDLENNKQDKNLSKTIAEATTVEGALINIDAYATALAGRVSTAESEIDALQDTVSNPSSGLVKKVNYIAADVRTINNTKIPELDKRVTANSKSITILDGKVTNLDTNKQDKSINIPGIEAKTVEGALQELDGESSAHTESINSLKAADEGLITKVNNLEQSAYGGETPIGTYPSADTLPTSEQLTAFVQQEVSRAPKLGDVVLFTQIVTGGTDKSYKFMYTATGWSNYVIPTVESATNTDKGILQGTLGDTTGDIQVSIVDGKVADILVKDGTTYKSIKTLLDGLATKINNAQNTADNIIKKYNNVEFTFVSSEDNTLTNFPCKYTANIEGVTINNVADVYFSALQIPLEIFSSYVQVEAGKVSIFATTKAHYPESVTVPTVRIS